METRDLSNVVGIGTDLVDVARLASALERRPGLVDRLFTPAERSYCESARSTRNAARRFAARFAAKEAAMKALGTGLGRIGWRDVEVIRTQGSPPTLRVSGHAQTLATQQGGHRWFVSLTHTDDLAHAIVVLTGPADAGRCVEPVNHPG